MNNQELWEKQWSSDSPPKYAGIPKRLFELLIREMPGKSILELGMGSGELTAAFAQRGFTVDAVDYSEAAVSKAKTLIDNAGLGGRVKLYCDDIDAFAFPKTAYSAIVASNVINFFPVEKAQQIALRMQNSLKPGGIVYVSAISEEDFRFDYYQKSGASVDNPYFAADSSCFFTPSSLQRCFPGLKTLICESDFQELKNGKETATLCSIDYIGRLI